MEPEEFYNQLEIVMKNGDEESAKKFIVEHLRKLPEDLQHQIIGWLVEDALEKKVERESRMLKFQKDFIQITKSLQRAEEHLEKQKKLLEIKESL